MTITTANTKIIHKLLITDMKQRLFEKCLGYCEYNCQSEILIDAIMSTHSLNDINELVIKYADLYSSKDWMTLDGTMNYVLALMCERIDNDATIIHNWNLGINS